MRLQIGSIVQLNPHTSTNPAFAGCLMVVTEIKSWGVGGYVQVLGTRDEAGGQAYYRAMSGTFDDTCGLAPWIVGSIEEQL